MKFEQGFAQLGDSFYSKVTPTGFTNPNLVSANQNAADLIGLDFSKTDINYFCGNKLFENGDYISTVYAGHQFGTYVPQLGDGRAILIGQVNGQEIQLKGSGKTPYSRFGDGRAVLRSCIREYLCSEAMHHLGIPTTRALCIIGSDEDVRREEIEKAAMLTRIAPSHIRFGHFEYFYYTKKFAEQTQLLDFTIQNFYPDHSYEEFFEEVVTRTAKLIAKWQAYGFAHGVMNTDNMSILGITIDYGPFGFMESYDPNYICNHSDHTGRYAFNQQPFIGLWNLHALAQSLEKLIPLETSGQILKKYHLILGSEYVGLMIKKLGLAGRFDSDTKLISDILDLMENNHVDYTKFFRELPNNPRNMFVDVNSFDGWYIRYIERYKKSHLDQSDILQANPKYILRNYLAEQAIRKANSEADYSEVNNLQELLSKPYEEQPENAKYANEPPDWGKCLEISCSS